MWLTRCTKWCGSCAGGTFRWKFCGRKRDSERVSGICAGAIPEWPRSGFREWSPTNGLTISQQCTESLEKTSSLEISTECENNSPTNTRFTHKPGSFLSNTHRSELSSINEEPRPLLSNLKPPRKATGSSLPEIRKMWAGLSGSWHSVICTNQC